MDQGKILITEDEESLRYVLQKALEDEGFWVQTAANGNDISQFQGSNIAGVEFYNTASAPRPGS